MRISLRPTTLADLRQITHEPLPIRIRAISAIAGDRVLGVGGIGYRPDNVVIGFAVISDELRAQPMALHRAGLAMMKIIRESGVPQVIAIADENVAAATRWLERLGFTGVLEHGRKVYVWNAVSLHG